MTNKEKGKDILQQYKAILQELQELESELYDIPIQSCSNTTEGATGAISDPTADQAINIIGNGKKRQYKQAEKDTVEAIIYNACLTSIEMNIVSMRYDPREERLVKYEAVAVDINRLKPPQVKISPATVRCMAGKAYEKIGGVLC